MAVDAGVSGGVATDNTNWNTGLTVSIPSSSSGDLLVLFAFRDEDDGGDWSTPSGWTRHTAIDGTETAGRDRVSMVCTKSSSGSEPSTINVAGTVSNSRQMSACIVNYGSADGLDVTPTASHRVADTNDDTPPNAAITTATNDAMVVVMTGLAAANTVSAWAAPTGYTLVDSQTGNAAIGIAEKLVSTAGTESPGDWTNTASGNIGEYIGATIAIKPSAGGSGATVSPSGQVMTSSQGSLTVSGGALTQLSGQEISASIGTITVGIGSTVSITGQSITAGQGSLSLTAGALVSLSGQSSSASQGALSVAGGASLALSGLEVSSSQGSVSVSVAGSVTVGLTGQVVTAQSGSLVVSGGAVVSLSGQVINGQQGTISISAGDVVVSLSGQQVASAQGALGVATGASISISGQEIQISQGTVSLVTPGQIVSGKKVFTAQPVNTQNTANPVSGLSMARAVNRQFLVR